MLITVTCGLWQLSLSLQVEDQGSGPCYSECVWRGNITSLCQKCRISPSLKHTSPESGSAFCQDLQAIHMHTKACRTHPEMIQPLPLSNLLASSFLLACSQLYLPHLAGWLSYLAGSTSSSGWPQLQYYLPGSGGSITYHPPAHYTALFLSSLVSLLEIIVLFIYMFTVYPHSPSQLVCSLHDTRNVACLIYCYIPRTKNNIVHYFPNKCSWTSFWHWSNNILN